MLGISDFPPGRAGNPGVDHDRRGATRVATPDFLPGRAGFLTAAAHGCPAQKHPFSPLSGLQLY